jgi:hypothetical protein
MWKIPRFINVKRLPSNLSLSEFLRLYEARGLARRPMMNSFTARVAQICPGFGSPNSNDTDFLNANIALSGTGQQSNTLPSTGTWTAPYTIAYGWLRIKIYSGLGTAPALADIVATLSDGTNTCQIAQVHPNSAVTISSTSLFDEIFPFFTGITGTSITVKTTLGGLGPGATMDMEVAGGVGSNPTQS